MSVALNRGDRTMIDALEPALSALEDGIALAASAARDGATQTAGMSKANAGRATYVNAEPFKGRVDPGAEARSTGHLQTTE